MQNYNFCSAKDEDLENIKAINERCLPENYSIEIFQQLKNATLICKEKQSDTIVGYAMLANLAITDNDLIPYSFTSRGKQVCTFLFSLAVTPEHRRKGIASRLMKIILDSNKKNPILLHSRVSNDAAQGLYKRYGFNKLKSYLGYYHNPDEDCDLMIRIKGKKASGKKKH
jgi:ribosomal protein S18 acetylase RimI-like enzyme